MKLLAFSGKKQSGKDSCAKFLVHYAHVLFGMEEHDCQRESLRHDKSVKSETVTYRLPVRVQTYYFGEPMKDFAEFLGVEHRKLWGTDAEKNELTHIKWETLPHYRRLVHKTELQILDDAYTGKLERPVGDNTLTDTLREELKKRLPTGLMTARQLLQQIGEDMFLQMDPYIWMRAFERVILRDKGSVDMGFVPDPRKPGHIDLIHKLGGKVIRLLRDPYEGTDRHISETALDPDVYDQTKFDAIIDNRQMTVVQTRMQLVGQLMQWGFIERKPLDIEWVTPDEKGAA